MALVAQEAVLVTLMAVAVALSAFSVWQATLASDEADDLSEQTRVAAAEALRQAGYAETLVDHDINVLATYCAARFDRDSALFDVFSNKPPPAGLVEGDLTMRALEPLLQADTPDEPCAEQDLALASQDDVSGYSLARAEQNVADLGSKLAPESIAISAEREALLGVTERRLMSAGVAFALTFFGLIAVDLLGDRSEPPIRWSTSSVGRARRAGALLAVSGLAVGGVILAAQVRGGDLLLGIAGVAALVIAGVALGRRRDDGEEVTSRSWAGRPHWFAELVGALTLVAFATAAWGLSSVSTTEREQRAEADRQHVAAQRLLQTGEQSALRDLAVVAQLAALDAKVAAANQANDIDRAVTLKAIRDATAKHNHAQEQSVRTRLSGVITWAHGKACPVAPTDVPVEPSALLEVADEQVGSFQSHVLAHGAAATTCDVLATTTREAASAWGRKASQLTVSLVILGLAGFLLALAADPDRSRRSALWLLVVGSLGSSLGVLMGAAVLPVVHGGAEPLGKREAVRFAEEVSAGRHDSCDLAVEDLDRAIERNRSYAPAFAARADARFCTAADPTARVAMSSAVDDDALPAIVDDLVAAVRLSPADITARAQLGWAHILSGLQDRSEDDLRRGVEESSDALRRLEPIPESTSAVHALRFNIALAHAALGDEALAAQKFDEAVQCLDPAHHCRGGGVIDADRRAEYALWALADLELAEPSSDLDSYRETIVASFQEEEPTSQSAHLPRGGWDNIELDVFPTEVQLSDSSRTKPNVAVVWYHRAASGRQWGVLAGPSHETLSPGAHLDVPFGTGHVLPAGDYRADIYIGADKVVSIDRTHEPPVALTRRASRQLGLSVAVPEKWTGGDVLAGVEWAFGPSGSNGVAFKRLEGVIPDEDVLAYLQGQLDGWVAERAGTGEAVGTPAPSQYFLGLNETVVHDYAGYGVRAAAGLAPYGSDGKCGGAVILALVGGPGVDDDVARKVFDSMSLTAPVAKLPSISNPYEADAFALEFPQGWDAASRLPGSSGNEFVAKDCTTLGANVFVTVEAREGRSLENVVDASLKAFSTDTEGFPGFDAEEPRPLAVPGSTEATELVFTWLRDGTPVFQRQVYAADADTIVYMTFTTHGVSRDYYQDAADTVVHSFAMRGSPD